jgi:hypothetical protein
MAYADQRFRHGLRNSLNSLGLVLKAFEISDASEQLELIDLIIQSADEAIAIIDENPPEEETPVAWQK